MEYVNCDLCGSDQLEMVTSQTDRLHGATEEISQIVRCVLCGLHFTNPRPTALEIARYYGSSYSFHAKTPKWRCQLNRFLNAIANSPFAGWASVFPPLAKSLVARIKPPIEDPVLRFYKEGAEGSFLDIGCGTGIHAHFWGADSALQSLKGRGDVAGVEISPEARSALTSEGIRCWPDLASVPSAERFGLIRMNWSLEHVHSPKEYFSFIAKHLLEDGQAIITVPNYSGLIYRLAPDCVELPVHLYHFRPVDILAYGKQFGLSAVECKTFSYPEMFRAAASVGLLPQAFPARLGIAEARVILDFLKPMDTLGWGNDMLVVFKKSQFHQKSGDNA